MKPATSPEATPVALMDAMLAFIRVYKQRMRTILTDVSSTQSTPSRVMVVVVLRKSGALPMGAIAAHVGLPKSNVTALVDDLESEGVLRRRGDETDRRITLVELTARGRALCAREYDAYEQSIAAIFDTLPSAERVPMLSALGRMTRLLRDDEAARGVSASEGARASSRGKGRARAK